MVRRIQIVTWESSPISNGRRDRARRLAPTFRAVVALLVLVTLGISGVGWAAPPAVGDPKSAARRKLLEGAKLIKEGNYEAALARFKSAYDLVPSPKIRYDLGIAYMGLERNAEAFEAFQLFLADASESSTETITKARLYKDSLLLKICRLTVRSDAAGATITIDGRPKGITPSTGEFLLDGGTHSLVVAKVGVRKTFTQWFDAVLGGSLTIEANILPPPPPQPPRVPAPTIAVNLAPAAKNPDLSAIALNPDAPSGRWARRTGFVTGGLALAALGFGTFEWVIKEQKYRAFNRGCDKGLPNLGGPGCQGLLDAGSHAQTLGYIGFASGGALAIASTVFFVVGRSHPESGGNESALACAPTLNMPGGFCRLEF